MTAVCVVGMDRLSAAWSSRQETTEGGEKRVTGDDFKRIDVMEDKKIKSTRAANWSPLFLEPLRCEESRTKAWVGESQ